MKTHKFWMIFLLVSIIMAGCVKDEIFQGPPLISDLLLNPQIPSEGQAVTVSIKVTDMNGVKSVTLFYKAGAGSYTSVAMTGSGNIYTAQIPGQDMDVTVNYYIKAENNTGQTAYYPAGAPSTTGAYTVGAALIVMNEIYSRGVVSDPDWIEIYNASDVAVDIGGYLIYDNGGQSGAKPKLPIPAGTIIPAKGFYVIVTDIGGENGFGLSSGGEEVWLENDKGNIIDNVNFPAMAETQSYGRNPDGSQNWELLNVITKGSANSTAPPVAIVKMNEIYSRGTTTDPDWIELYNNSDFVAAVGGYALYDNGGQSGSKPKLALPAGTTIPAKGFLVVVVDDGSASGFGLGSGGETVWFENASGTIIDSVAFPALDETQSYGRYPDGTGSWQILHVITKGAANDNSAPPPPALAVMNEIYSRGTVTDPDWIEFYNLSSNPLDISGYKIYDSGGNSGAKPKKEIPSGTIIPANGFFWMATEGTGDPSDFGLSSTGELVWFENTSGTVIDSIGFAAMSETQSYGRLPDGTGSWQLLNSITRGAPNSNAMPNHIWMNEIYSRGVVTDPDWIEIYNSSSTAIDISGYKIYDSGGNTGSKPKKEFPAGTIIPAQGFFVIVVDDTTASGFGLSSSGEEVWLENASGTVIDNIAFPALDVTQSYGRKPDGSANLVIFTDITKGTSNNNAGTLPKKRR